MNRLAVLTIVVAATSIAPAHAEERAPRVAIVTATAINVENAEATRLASALATAIDRELIIDAIAGEDVNRRLADGKVPDGCVARAECLAEISERLDADQLLLLTIIKLGGDSIQVDPTFSDAKGTHVVSRPTIKLTTADDWDEAFAEAAPRLLPDAKRRPSGAVTIVLPASPTEDQAPGREVTTGVWIAGSIGLSALAGAVSFSIAANRADNRLQRGDCDLQPCDESLVTSLERRALAADLLFTATIAAGVTAGVLYYLSDRERDGLEVQAGASASGGAVMVKGSF